MGFWGQTNQLVKEFEALVQPADRVNMGWGKTGPTEELVGPSPRGRVERLDRWP